MCRYTFAGLILCLGVSSCAVHPVFENETASRKLDELIEDVVTDTPERSILYLPDEIQRALDENIKPRWSDGLKLKKLREYLYGETSRKIVYDANQTRTASETYYSRLGNRFRDDVVVLNLSGRIARDTGVDAVPVRRHRSLLACFKTQQ